MQLGLAPRDARAEARLAVAVARGLLLDLLATRDRAAVDAAFERYLARYAALQRPGAAAVAAEPAADAKHAADQADDPGDRPVRRR